MKQATYIFVTVLLLAGIVGAQVIDEASNMKPTPTDLFGSKPTVLPSSLLDGSRMSWSHSYSFSFFSGGNTTGSVGLLNSTMNYELSSKLTLALNLGIMHRSSALRSSSDSRDATLLPGFALNYRPSEKVTLSLSVQRVSGFANPYPYSPRRSYSMFPSW